MTARLRPIPHSWVVAGLTLLLAMGLSATVVAQQGQPTPQDLPVPAKVAEPQGLLAEPAWMERAAVFSDRHLGSGGTSNGFYLSTKSPIQGSGWITLGPGYRHWYKRDSIFIDGSAGLSWRGYKMAQGRLEFPKLLRSRLTLGTMYRWQDFRSVKTFGEGPDSSEDALATYHLTSHNVVGYAAVPLARWLTVNASVGALNPSVRFTQAPEPQFFHGEASLVADTRDFPNHPTRGALVRVAASRFTDRDNGAFSFKRYESEATGFIPLASARVVVALRGWLVASATDAGQSVPFYLQPTLGGGHSLRSFSDFRFRDDSLLLANAEVRLAMFTHLDAVVFADAGNVAAQWRDLDLNHQSFGAGLRFHTRRDTIARFDAAQGAEGWRFTFSLSEPLSLTRTFRRTAPTPFVP